VTDIEKGKKKRTRRTATVHFYENLGKPARSRSEALAEIRRDEAEECAAPDAVKGTMGNPVDPMAPSGPKALALGHPDMRQGTTRPMPLLGMRSNADEFPADLRGMSSGVPVALSRLDAASAAGMPAFRAEPYGNPVSRPLDHSARNSATPPDGGHSLADPRSHAAPMAAKAMTGSEARAALKRHMFPGSGAR
jgi:hypothetical protein